MDNISRTNGRRQVVLDNIHTSNNINDNINDINNDINDINNDINDIINNNNKTIDYDDYNHMSDKSFPPPPRSAAAECIGHVLQRRGQAGVHP